MTEGGELTVQESRKIYLDELKKRVDHAYNHPLKSDFNKDGTIKTRVENAKQIKRELSAKKYIDAPDNKDPDHIVSVDNSHDFPDLLRLAYRKANPEYYENDRYRKYYDVLIEGAIKDKLEHEYKHHVPLLGHKKGKLRYGIGFFKDRKTGELQMISHISFAGRFPTETIIDAFAAPPNPSKTDSIVLSGKK